MVKVDKLLVNHGIKKAHIYKIRNDEGNITIETEETLKIIKRLFIDRCDHSRNVKVNYTNFH